ncbi:MAG: hypothetical protein LAP86_27945 [Acidobacteriia bacterium]|nr:hypothetical protein [Terriglobia bacterium]
MLDIIEVAHHEAGHAVAAFVLNLKIARKGLTIVPNEQSRGSVSLPPRFRERLDTTPGGSLPPSDRIRIENYAIAACAGDEAQKRFNPHRRYQGHDDVEYAEKLLSNISGNDDICSARLKVARLEARSLVNKHWDEIEAVAATLLEHKTLTPEQAQEAWSKATRFLIVLPKVSVPRREIERFAKSLRAKYRKAGIVLN